MPTIGSNLNPLRLAAGPAPLRYLPMNKRFKVSYRIIQMVRGRTVATRPTDIIAWAEANGRSVSWPTVSQRLRPELQQEPRIGGLCGPMYDGEENGAVVIRYEDSATNDLLSG
jgi:hypothetical protein